MQEAKGLRDCRMGHVLSIVLFSNAPRVYRFLPSVIGVDMWRQGASEKLMQLFHQMGCCVSSPAARSHVDNLTKEYKEDLKVVKKDIEEVRPFFLS